MATVLMAEPPKGKAMTMHQLKITADEAAAAQIRLEAAIAIMVNQHFAIAQRRADRALDHQADKPDRPSVRRAMAHVERRLVEALWTMRLLPDREARFVYGSARHGIDYMQEREDVWYNRMETGKYEDIEIRPAPPSSRAIDRMYAPLDWFQWLQPDHAKFVSACAISKQGDASRNIRWSRVRLTMHLDEAVSIRTMQRRYDSGLRDIASHLT